MTNFTDSNGKVIGKGIGIFTVDYKELSKSKYIEGIIEGVEKFRTNESRNIIFDNLDLLELKDIKYIENKTKLKVLDGKKTMIYFMPSVLKEFYSGLESNLTDKEILIISDDSFLTYDLIRNLSGEARFLTVTGEDEKWIEDISYKIYDTTGLSIFYTKNIDRILKKYDIIINLSEYILVNIDKLRGNVIVFDLSFENILTQEAKKINSKILVVEDFLFEYERLVSEKQFFHEKKEIPSHKYEVFDKKSVKDFKKVLVNGNSYTLEDLINNRIKKKVKF